MHSLLNYDDEDYCNERDCFIREAQAQVWDLWQKRFLSRHSELNDQLKLELVEIVEDWTGHSFALDIEVPSRPDIDIPF